MQGPQPPPVDRLTDADTCLAEACQTIFPPTCLTPGSPHPVRGSREQKNSPRRAGAQVTSSQPSGPGLWGPSLLGHLVSQWLHPVLTQAAPGLFLLTKEPRLSSALSDLLWPGKQGW